jgi:hypothetical protein
MYAWTKGEFLAMSLRFGGARRDADAVYDVCGGNIRYSSSVDKVKGFVSTVLGNNDSLSKLTELYRNVEELGESKEKKLSHALLNIVARVTVSERDYANHRVVFTEYAMQELMKKIDQVATDQREFLLESLSPTAGMRGSVFERYMHERLTKTGTGVTFQLFKGKRQSPQSSESALEWEPDPVDVTFSGLEKQVVDDPIASVIGAVAAREQGLFVPQASNFAAVDSFAVVRIKNDPVVFAFQMTISTEHSYDTDQLHKYKAALPRGIVYRYCVMGLSKNRYCIRLTIPQGISKAPSCASRRNDVESQGIWFIGV